jgi:hypothetical protein
MKRTCLQKNTKTDEQNRCEFHPAKILLKEQHVDPKGTQQVKSIVRMKNINATNARILIRAFVAFKNHFIVVEFFIKNQF